MSTARSQQPAPISSPPFVLLALRLGRVHLEQRQPLPQTGSIFVAREPLATLFESLYTDLLSREGVVFAPGTGDRGHEITLAAVHSQPQQDVLVPIAADARESTIDVREALLLAQVTRRVVVPVGISCGARWPLSRSCLPLPLSRIVAAIESPFEVPRQPEQIPEPWIDTILRLLKQAEGRAQDHLATWRRSGRP